MKHRVLRLITWAALLVFILPTTGLAAGQGPDNPRSGTTANDYDHWIYLPLIGKNTSFLTPIIPSTTNPLPPETTAGLLSVSPDGITYTFDTMTTALAAVAPGEIIVAAPSAAAPNGFLRRVTAINAAGGDVVVQTQPATLEDAIQQGEIVFSRRLSPEGLAAQDLAPGVTLRPASVVSPQAAFYLEIRDVVIYDDDGNPGTTNDQVLANGSIEFEPTLNFDLRIRQGKIEYLQFTVDAKETAELEIEARLTGAGLKKEKLLGNPIHLQTFVVWVGPVPVVFAPVLTFQIGIDGGVHVGVTTGVTQELTASAGVKYVNQTWGPITRLSNSFTWTPPTLHAGLDLKGYASARLQVLVYGVVGPYGDVGLYLKLEADTSATPWWQLYGGIEVPVGVRVDLLGYKEIASYEVLAIGERWLLAQASTANPCSAGQTLTDPADDVSPAHIDVTKMTTSLDNDLLQATFTLRDIPAQLTFARVGVPKNYKEYEWSVYVDVDNNPQTGVPYGRYKGADFSLSAMHFVAPFDVPITLPIANGVQVDTWQCDSDGCGVLAHATLSVDPQSETMTLAGRIPGINANSRLFFVTYDYNPGGTPQVDISSCSVAATTRFTSTDFFSADQSDKVSMQLEQNCRTLE